MKSDADVRALGLLVQVHGGAPQQRQTLGRFELPTATQHLQLLRCQHEADSVTHSINIPRESLELLWLEPLDAAIVGAQLTCAEFALKKITIMQKFVFAAFANNIKYFDAFFKLLLAEILLKF